jgi:ERCC4-related helicase
MKNKTETIIQAVKRLEEVKELLEMTGLFEQLEKIGAWSPRHYTERLEQVADELAEARERQRVAIESWDEERQRALREGQRVVEAMEQNAKLRKIAEWFADHFVDECYCYPVIQKAEQLRAELDQLRKETK